MTLEQDVLRRIKPSKEKREEIHRKVNSILSRTAMEASKEELGLEVVLVGSVAKDTFLQDPDIDVFLLFPESVPRTRLEAVGLELGREILGKGEERYAEHPYIHGYWEGSGCGSAPTCSPPRWSTTSSTWARTRCGSSPRVRSATAAG
jgi:tRNA nucleotidyltransferase (CCA-adding enzyme)